MIKQISIACLSVFLSANAAANSQWELNSDNSHLHYVSVKNASVAELNEFTQLSGDIADDGQATVSIDLGSVETGVDIRNTRVVTMLFETESHPTADITTTVDMDMIGELSAGDISHQTVDFELSLHGATDTVSAQVQVIKLSDEQLLVNTLSPIIINADTYDLVEGLNELREVAGLSSITTAVPVTFSLMFEHHDD